MMRVVIWLLLLVCSIAVGNAEVYIVLMHGKAVVHNKETSSAAPGYKIDSSSHLVQAYASSLTQHHDALLEATFEQSSYTKLYSYNHLLHGFAVDITDKQAATLKLSNRVKLVSKERVLKTQTTFTPTLLGLETGAWPELGGVKNSGEGVVIGIVDTGINPVHPSFSTASEKPYHRLKHFTGTCQGGADFSSKACNRKLVGARYFAASAKMHANSSETFSVFDTVGHGSHTASTAAGNHGVPLELDGVSYGNATGVAPRARIAAYKAFFGEKGHASDVIAAVEQAVRDGVDILSLSLGSTEIPEGPSVFTDPFEQALLSAIHAGVFVVQAAGNDGPGKTSMSSYSPWVLSVAASNTGRGYKASVELGNGKIVAGVGLSPATSPGTKYPLLMAKEAYTGTNYLTSSCGEPSQFNRSLVQGRIFVCEYSKLESLEIPRVLQVAKAAKDLGAIGFAMLLDPSSPFSNYMTSLYPMPIPGVVINNINASLELLSYYNATNEPVARINENTVEFNRTAPIVMDFSSRGPSVSNTNKDPVDVLKPNILAPGNAIWAAWSPSAATFPGSNFVLQSGTSMATPHVAGAAALIKQKHPNWTPAAISSAIMTTASIVDSQGHVLQAIGAAALSTGTPFDFGAGFINITAALNPGIVFDAGSQDYVSFLCSLNRTEGWKDVVKQATHSDCSIAMVDEAYNLNSPSITVSRLNQTVTVRRRVTSVTNVMETYTAALVQPENVTATIVPSFFSLGPFESASFEVQLGLKGQEVLSDYVFGQLTLQGDKGHSARVFISVASKY